MGKTSWIAKTKMPAKFSTRRKSRCNLCGRSHAFLRKFGICRICFRTLALAGEIPGVRKASW
jgi:small subunit ribosomal protein S14